MKFLLRRYCAFSFLLLLLPLLLPAQNQYTFPKRVALAGIEPSIPNQERNAELDPAGYFSAYVENFHPIGWSNDGKAAFLTWSEGEFSCHLGLVIYDAVKDSTIASWWDDFGDDNQLSSERVENLWKLEKDSLLPLLKRFHIVQETHASYYDFPFSLKNGTQNKSFGMEYSLSVSKDDERFHDSISLTCEITENQKTDSVKMKLGNLYALDISPTGLWISPDQQYALLILFTEDGGQHGDEPPHSFHYYFHALKLPD